MMKGLFISACLLFLHETAIAQDTTVMYKNQAFTLTDVVVRNNFNVASFIEYVKNDTTFYKAFRNLHVLNYSSFNDIRMLDKKQQTQASLLSVTRQLYADGCRTMEVKEEKATGDFYTKKGNYNYTTAEMYAGLFFTKGKVCGENNIVGQVRFSTKGKSGMEKHKEQLKQLFFNPGQDINGIPFIGNKVALFDENIAKNYDYMVDKRDYMGKSCYVFTIKPKPEKADKSKIVIDKMVTWFDAKTLDITGREYSLSYRAGVYDFDVSMEVQLVKFGELLVPKVLRYHGEWDILLKKKERSIFTATLFDFKK